MSRITTYPKITEISPEDLLVISDVSTPYTSTRTVTVQDLVGGSTAPLALTTFGTSGEATLINNVLNVPNYSSGTMSSWNAGVGGEGGFEVSDGELVSFIGGTKLSSAVTSETSSITFDHNPTTRQDTTSAVAPGSDGTFTVIDSITQDSTGHTTAVNVKTVTMPTTGGGGGMTQWRVDDGGAGGFVVQNNDAVLVQPGAKIDLVTSTAFKRITWSHEDTTRNDTTSTAAPAAGATFTVIDSITQDATGHPTAVNVKTVTMPAGGGGGGTTYDLASAQDGDDVDITLTPSTGAVDTVQLTAGSGITLTDNGSNNITIDAAAGGSGLWTATGNDIYNNNSNAVVIGKTTAATDTTAALEVSGRVSQVGLGGSTFFGFRAGKNDDLSSNSNTGFGHNALTSNTSGFDNTAFGASALILASTATSNTAIGASAMQNITTGSSNVAIGSGALRSNQTSATNIAIGVSALRDVTGSGNVGVGYRTMEIATSCISNTAMGNYALRSTTTSQGNAAFGNSALEFIGAGGGQNVAVGNSAGSNYTGITNPLTQCEKSIFIGTLTKAKANNSINEIVIGHDLIGNGSNTITLGNADNEETHLTGVVVLEGYAFSNLPASPVVGMRTYITDSAFPTYYTNAAGGGNYKAPVFYDGSNWLWA
jgi:hypothetical protein